jgi:hypothetical protein
MNLIKNRLLELQEKGCFDKITYVKFYQYKYVNILLEYIYKINEGECPDMDTNTFMDFLDTLIKNKSAFSDNGKIVFKPYEFDNYEQKVICEYIYNYITKNISAIDKLITPKIIKDFFKYKQTNEISKLLTGECNNKRFLKDESVNKFLINLFRAVYNKNTLWTSTLIVFIGKYKNKIDFLDKNLIKEILKSFKKMDDYNIDIIIQYLVELLPYEYLKPFYNYIKDKVNGMDLKTTAVLLLKFTKNYDELIDIFNSINVIYKLDTIKKMCEIYLNRNKEDKYKNLIIDKENFNKFLKYLLDNNYKFEEIVDKIIKMDVDDDVLIKMISKLSDKKYCDKVEKIKKKLKLSEDELISLVGMHPCLNSMIDELFNI